MRVLPYLLILASLPLWPVRGEEEAPVARLFDTGVASAERRAEAFLPAPNNWHQVPEDNTNHQFSGDAVLKNDKLTIVLPKRSNQPEIYSQTATGPRHRATVGFVGTNSQQSVLLEGLKIVENTSAGLTVETALKTGGTIRLRLTTGEPTLEIQASKDAGFLDLRSRTRYVAVPDYFGDDMVFAVEGTNNLCLPAENYCLNLVDGEDAMIMGVWQSNQQDVWLRGGGGGQQGNSPATRVRCLNGQKIWLAFFESPSIWHARMSKAGDTWKPPFPAKWRASSVRGNGMADSWDLERGPGPGQNAEHHEGPLILYPIDRSTSTPLTAMCTIDVMRNTLGVGPCQYILSCEGLGAHGDPTPNSVMGWVEKQFEQRKQKKSADDIRERLEFMTQHLSDARMRIARYGEFAARVRKSLAGEPGSFALIVGEIERLTAIGLDSTASPERGRQLAGEVMALIGNDDGLDACRRLGQQLRVIGTIQDSTLAKCRMAVRRLRAEGRTISVERPQDEEKVQRVERLAAQMLQNK